MVVPRLHMGSHVQTTAGAHAAAAGQAALDSLHQYTPVVNWRFVLQQLDCGILFSLIPVFDGKQIQMLQSPIKQNCSNDVR